jgi:hypothetical protein
MADAGRECMRVGDVRFSAQQSLVFEISNEAKGCPCPSVRAVPPIFQHQHARPPIVDSCVQR